MGVNRQEEQFDFSFNGKRGDKDAPSSAPEGSEVVPAIGEGRDEVVVHAARAAETLLSSNTIDDRSAAERAYDELQDRIERARGQGVDAVAALRAFDSDGKITRAYEHELAERQDELNHTAAEDIRQTLFNKRLADIEAIADLEERRRAKIQFLAQERARDAKRGRRW